MIFRSSITGRIQDNIVETIGEDRRSIVPAVMSDVVFSYYLSSIYLCLFLFSSLSSSSSSSISPSSILSISLSFFHTDDILISPPVPTLFSLSLSSASTSYESLFLCMSFISLLSPLDHIFLPTPSFESLFLSSRILLILSRLCVGIYLVSSSSAF